MVYKRVIDGRGAGVMRIEDNLQIDAGLAIWMFVVFFAWTSYWGWNAVHVSRVAERQHVGHATVIALGKWNHGQTYDYTFRVGNQSFTDNSLGPLESTYRKGQRVPVYYDPNRPNTSSLREFSWSPIPDGIPVGFGLGALIFAFLRWRRARARR